MIMAQSIHPFNLSPECQTHTSNFLLNTSPWKLIGIANLVSPKRLVIPTPVLLHLSHHLHHLHSYSCYKPSIVRNSHWAVQWLGLLHFHCCGPGVQPLVRELRSYKPSRVAWPKKKKKKRAENLAFLIVLFHTSFT